MKLTMKPGNALEKRLGRMIRFLIEEQKRTNNIDVHFLFDPSKSLWLKIVFVGVFIFSTAILICQSCNRILHYFTYPVEVDILFEPMLNVQFPKFSLCVENTEETEKLMINNSLDNMYCVYMMVSLVGNVEGMNMTTLWAAANTTTTITRVVLTHSDEKPLFNEVSSPYGICTALYSDKKHLYKGEDTALKVEFKTPRKQCPLAQVRVAFTHDDQVLDYQNGLSIIPGYRWKMGMALQKYNFVNRPNSKCDPHDSAYDRCMKECRFSFYKERLCKYPFTPDQIDLPTCLTGEDVGEDFEEAYAIYLGFATNSEDCNCLQACQQVFYDGVIIPEEITGNVTTLLTFYFRKNYVTVFSERLVYGVGSLLADIGGNLGICLGWSILDILYWLCIVGKITQRKNKPLLFRHNDPIYRIVRNLYRKVYDRPPVNDKDKSPVLVYGWWACASLAALCALYLVVVRIQYYFSFPTKTQLNVVNNITVQYPTVTVCWESSKITQFLKAYARYKRISNYCNVTLYDLMEPPFKYSQERIWKYADSSDNRFKIKEMKNQNLVPIAFPMGTCMKFVTAPVSHAETFYHFDVLRFYLPGSENECHKYVKVFVTPPDELIDPTRYELFPDRTISSILFTLKIFHREEETLNKENVMERALCRSICISKRMAKKLKCRMPFIPLYLESLPLCNTSREARTAEDIYIEAFVATNPEEDCGCPAPSQYTIYDSRTAVGTDDVGVTLMVFVVGNTRVEHFSKVSSYDKSKLFSELGGNVSAILGLSVISVMEVLYKIYTKLFGKRRNYHEYGKTVSSVWSM